MLAEFEKRITIYKMEPKITGRGGPGRGQGRKALPEDEVLKPVTVKLNEQQKEKLQRLGGGPWVRAKIDQAKEPKEKPRSPGAD